MLTTPKPATCKAKGCNNTFIKYRSFEKYCVDCATVAGLEKLAKKKRQDAAKERTVDQVKKESLKRRADWAREAQACFNTWVRLRDADRPCISCGRHHKGQYHAGHYLSVGARPELRYEPLNVWKQCSACNLHLSGNVVLFRVALLREIGSEKVEWLEGPHEVKHYSIDDLKVIKDKYKKLANELKKSLANPK